jgi:uncharacterized Rmd1/YagE family protein
MDWFDTERIEAYVDFCEALDFQRRLDVQNTKLDYCHDLATTMLAFEQARSQEESNGHLRRQQRYAGDPIARRAC